MYTNEALQNYGCYRNVKLRGGMEGNWRQQTTENNKELVLLFEFGEMWVNSHQGACKSPGELMASTTYKRKYANGKRSLNQQGSGT